MAVLSFRTFSSGSTANSCGSQRLLYCVEWVSVLWLSLQFLHQFLNWPCSPTRAPSWPNGAPWWPSTPPSTWSCSSAASRCKCCRSCWSPGCNSVGWRGESVTRSTSPWRLEGWRVRLWRPPFTPVSLLHHHHLHSNHRNNTHSNDDFNSPACTVICCDSVFLLVNIILMMLCRSDVCSCSTTVVLVLFYSNILRVVVFSAAPPFRHQGCLRWPKPNHIHRDAAARLWRVQLLSEDQLRLLGPQSLWDGAHDENPHLLRPEVWHHVPAGVAKRGERSVQRSSLLFTQHRWDSQGSSHTKNSQIMPVYIFSVMWHSWKMPVWLLDSVEMHW